MMNKHIFFVCLVAIALGTIRADDLLDTVLSSKPQETFNNKPLTSDVNASPAQVRKTSAKVTDDEEIIRENTVSKKEPFVLSLRFGVSLNTECEWDGIDEIGLAVPFENSDFGINARLTALRFQDDDYSPYYRYEWDSELGVDAVVFWQPIHGKVYSPFVELGLRYEDMEYESYDYNLYYRNDGEYKEWTSTGISFHIGCLLDFDRINILVEYMIGPESTELRGDFTVKLSKRIGIFAFAEKTSLSHVDYTSVGGGLSFYF